MKTLFIDAHEQQELAKQVQFRADEAPLPATPQEPNPGTDNHRLLRALQTAYPEHVWDVDTTLGMKANSRASNLRELGWDIESKCGAARTEGSRKRRWGYRLLTPPCDWPNDPRVGAA